MRKNQLYNLSDSGMYRRVTGGIHDTLRRPNAMGWFADFLLGFFQFFISIGALTVRVFLRLRMGSRSFGFLSIFLSYFWLRFCLVYIHIKQANCSNYLNAESGDKCNVFQHCYDSLLNLIIFLIPSFQDSSYSTDYSSLFKPFQRPDFGYNVYILSFIVLTLGLFHFLFSFLADLKKVKRHSLYRGYSLFFGRLEKRKIYGIQVSKYFIWMVLDPAFVYVIAVTLTYFENTFTLGVVLQIGALCLLIQEFIYWDRNRDLIRNLIDQELDSAYFLEEREKYKDEENNSSSNSDLNQSKSKVTLS